MFDLWRRRILSTSFIFVALGYTMDIYSYGHFPEDVLSPNSIMFTRFTLDKSVIFLKGSKAKQLIL